MMWVDYHISQVGDHFRIEGEWPGEVMGLCKDGSKKETSLYKPGDIFEVTKDGWLKKIGENNGN